jgi:hypothetical protein
MEPGKLTSDSPCITIAGDISEAFRPKSHKGK